MSETSNSIFTVGHSTHPFELFLSLIRKHGVTAVADVRSRPFSRFSPQFNRDALDPQLRENGIRYVFLGRELGARSDDPACYEKGRVRYDRLAQTEVFRQGLDRVMAGAREHRIALMCAEKEPLECHRTLLVARALHDRGVDVSHILAGGSLEAHAGAMRRLHGVTGVPLTDLFRTPAELLAEALARQEERVAYVDEKLSGDEAGEAS